MQVQQREKRRAMRFRDGDDAKPDWGARCRLSITTISNGYAVYGMRKGKVRDNYDNYYET
jgi:hypothetical protein